MMKMDASSFMVVLCEMVREWWEKRNNDDDDDEHR